MTEQPNALEAAQLIKHDLQDLDFLEDLTQPEQRALIVARAYLAAEARIRVLEQALTDIANGNVPAGFLNNIETESKASFQERFATWLQQRARRALTKEQP